MKRILWIFFITTFSLPFSVLGMSPSISHFIYAIKESIWKPCIDKTFELSKHDSRHLSLEHSLTSRDAFSSLTSYCEHIKRLKIYEIESLIKSTGITLLNYKAGINESLEKILTQIKPIGLWTNPTIAPPYLLRIIFQELKILKIKKPDLPMGLIVMTGDCDSRIARGIFSWKIISEDTVKYALLFILINNMILRNSFSSPKKTCFHEVTHLGQLIHQLKEKKLIPTINLKYMHDETEADTEAFLNLNCYTCACEATQYLWEESEHYLTRSKAEKILLTMDHDQLCPYHQGRLEGIPHETLLEEIGNGTRGI